VIVAIVILGVAGATGTFLGRAESRGIAGLETRAAVAAASELALVAVHDAFVGQHLHDLPVGASIARAAPASAPGVETTVHISRLGATLFSITATSEAGPGPSRRVNLANQLLVRLDPVDPGADAALAVRGEPITGAASIIGTDSATGDAVCEMAADDRPIEVAPDSTSLAAKVAALAPLATKRFPDGAALPFVGPVEGGGHCDRGAVTNWGDPAAGSPCRSYLPVVHAPGNLSIGGGRGQGILLVEGDLTVSGGFHFAGVVFVLGRFAVEGAGGSVAGSVLASTADLSGAMPGGVVALRRSTCTVQRALLSGSLLVPVVERPWAVLP